MLQVLYKIYIGKNFLYSLEYCPDALIENNTLVEGMYFINGTNKRYGSQVKTPCLYGGGFITSDCLIDENGNLNWRHSINESCKSDNVTDHLNDLSMLANVRTNTLQESFYGHIVVVVCLIILSLCCPIK